MNERLQLLFNKYYHKTISPAEKEELFALMADPSLEEAVKSLILNSYASGEKDEMPPAASDAVLQAILRLTETERAPVKRRRLVPVKWAVAATVAILLGTGAYMALRHTPRPDMTASQPAPATVPVKEGPVLTLASGKQISLDSLQNGLVASDGGADIAFKDQQLSYDPAGMQSGAGGNNTITTPKGRQFKIVLADGTQVWLNAASTLVFPTLFSGSRRTVEVTGEAYFEVAENATAPFHVMVAGAAEIQVLGTRFNVDAYPNDHIKATLMQGAVRVKATTPTGASVMLAPGEQARLGGNQKIVVKKVDTDAVMAWRNGIFNFDGVALKDVMAELARWYDIEVVYQNGIPDIRFFGELSRSLPLADVIKALEESKVHVKLEGNHRLVVLP